MYHSRLELRINLYTVEVWSDHSEGGKDFLWAVEGKNHHLVEEGTGCYCRVEDTEEAHTTKSSSD